MMLFLLIRILESALLFVMAFYGFMVLDSGGDAYQFFKVLLSTAVLTFAFSLASNYRLKYQKNRSYYTFQLFMLVVTAISMQIISDYGALLAFTIFIKSTLIIYYRIIDRNIFLSSISCVYPFLALIYLLLLESVKWSFDPVYIVLANLIAALLFFVSRDSHYELSFYIRKETFLIKLREIAPISLYLPVLALMFYFTSYDKFFVSHAYSQSYVESYARSEILAQAPLILILIVIFYFNPLIFSNKKIRSYFLTIKKYDFALIILLTLLSTLYAYIVIFVDNYIDIIDKGELLFNIVVFSSKVFAVYVSIRLTYWQLKQLEVISSFIALSVHLLYFLALALYSKNYPIDITMFLMVNSMLFVAVSMIISLSYNKLLVLNKAIKRRSGFV